LNKFIFFLDLEESPSISLKPATCKAHHPSEGEGVLFFSWNQVILPKLFGLYAIDVVLIT